MKNIFSLKRFLCLGIAVGGLAAGPALADPPGNWSGSYLGGFVGGTWSDFHNNPGAAGPSGSDAGFMGGGDVGNNWQFGRVVLGAEGDFSKLDNHSGSNGIKFDEDWMSTVRGRAGFSIDRFLPYVTAGLALTDAVSKVSGVGAAENIEPGYAVGGGMDALISDHWFGRVEYLRTDVPKNNATIGGTTVTGGSANNTVRVGLNYRF
jgi:outer membrane immunogenic protein